MVDFADNIELVAELCTRDQPSRDAFAAMARRLEDECAPDTNTEIDVVHWVEGHDFRGPLFLWLYSCGHQFARDAAIVFAKYLALGDLSNVLVYLAHLECHDLMVVVLNSLVLPGVVRIDVVLDPVDVAAA